jgi:hypothetical protein
MSKAASPCSSCPSSKSEPSGKKKIVYTTNIECVLEDVLPLNSDSTIKVKKFKKFLDYDLKTLNITGELQTYTHKNGFTHTKIVVTYQDKKTNKVNYLEIDVLYNTNKKVENTNKKVESANKQAIQCGSGYCGDDYPLETCKCGLYDTCNCPTDTINGVVSSSNETGVALASRTAKPRAGNNLALGQQVVVGIRENKCVVFLELTS